MKPGSGNGVKVGTRANCPARSCCVESAAIRLLPAFDILLKPVGVVGAVGLIAVGEEEKAGMVSIVLDHAGGLAIEPGVEWQTAAEM